MMTTFLIKIGKKFISWKKVNVNIYKDKSGFFDPLSVTKYKYLWHRGTQFNYSKKAYFSWKKNVKCLVQADLWDGDPDIDAICRIGLSPNVKFKKFKPFTSQNLTPFNSQNTFAPKCFKILPNVSSCWEDG